MGIILINLTFTIPKDIFAEAFLSFLGLGVQAPFASWGTMTNDSLVSFLMDIAGDCFFQELYCIDYFGFNAFGDGIQDALDPRARK